MNAAGIAALEQAVETAANRSEIGALFVDGVPHFGWQVPGCGSEADWLHRLTARFGGALSISARTLPHDFVAASWQFPSPICWPLTQTAGGLAVLNALREWLSRETSAGSG
jgi:hypothetical protein